MSKTSQKLRWPKKGTIMGWKWKLNATFWELYTENVTEKNVFLGIKFLCDYEHGRPVDFRWIEIRGGVTACHQNSNLWCAILNSSIFKCQGYLSFYMENMYLRSKLYSRAGVKISWFEKWSKSSPSVAFLRRHVQRFRASKDRVPWVTSCHH